MRPILPETTRAPIARALFALGGLASGVAFAQEATDLATQAEFFESRIRPALVEHCYPCHNSARRAEGGLALDHRDAARTPSTTGTAVVPGQPAESLILQVMRHEVEFLEMPEGGARLSDDVIADFERWIRDGAHDPRDMPPTPDELAAATSWEATLARRKEWWSYQPIQRATPPPAPKWSDHPVDAFIAREFERNGLERADAADRRTLIRRLSYTLTGLPPTLTEIDAYLADDRPGATERVVDRLLDSPHFGEHWARHWMDVVRYADSHGSEGDPSIPHAYRYRDYLIRAFNADVPYDQFVREHVAGDLFENPRLNADLGIDESAIGTAHWRLVFHGFAPTDALDEKVRFIDDEINVFGKAFLAQTISCARCHDHKFDAIGQADYYALFGVLGSCRPGMQDVNTAEKKGLHRAELTGLKDEIREAAAAAWSLERDAWISLLGAEAAGAADNDHPLHALNEVDRRVAEGASLAAAWRAVQAAVLDEVRGPAADAARRWDLGTTDGMRDWYLSGNGLLDGGSTAGEFAVAPEGPRILTGIYPAGVYTHLRSTRHRGVLQSARFRLDDEYEVWGRAIGSGARWRYVVQDYPRQGTVYPIVGLDAETWSWRRLDLSYWEGDSIHLEFVTSQDAPIEVGGADRSWFGVRDLVLRPKGAGGPVEPSDPYGLARAALEVTSEPPSSRDELVGRFADGVQRAIDGWRRSSLTDEEALLLDACLRHGLLANTLDGLPQLAAIVERYRGLEARVPLPTRVPGLLEADAADQPLFLRGDHKKPAEAVPRRFLEAIDPEPYGTPGSGRLELAADLVRGDNPLTARVISNRIWHYLFGRGLVTTPDNFGRLGAEPSHPELLDYLATRFVDQGWSIKETIRFLVTSKTWQLDSTPPPGASAADPENRWLSHARVRRLDAEAIRDSLFAVAGRLDARMYGPGFAANMLEPRRSVYVQSRRNRLDAFLTTFDSPVPFAPVGARQATNVPAQALAMLNDPLVWSVAAQWGDSIATDGVPSEAERIAGMFAAAIGRAPTEEESGALSEYAEIVRAAGRRDRERRAALEARSARARAAVDAIVVPVREQLVTGTESISDVTGPTPIARWDFRKGLEDTVGELDGTAHGSARLEGGGLLLDGGGHVSTPPIPKELHAKTLEAWVQIANPDQRGGGVVTVQRTDGHVFDSIVYGERVPRQWIAGSEFFHRTDDFGAREEAPGLGEAVHLAIAYDADGQVRAYRNGAPYGTPYTRTGPVTFRAGESQVLFGLRHGSPSPGRLLVGTVFEVRLYDRALSAAQVEASAAGGPLVSRADVLEALTTELREALVEHEAVIAASRRELEAMGEPARDGEAWTRVAHALFNMKEFLYLR